MIDVCVGDYSLGGRCLITAAFKALLQSFVFILLSVAQPTISLVHKSLIAAKYNQPSEVFT